MLLPGVRLVERPGVLHFFDGRRVVSVRGDEAGRRTLRRVLDGAAAGSGGDSEAGETDDEMDDGARADARALLARLRLGSEDAPELPVAAAYASATVDGWTSGRDAAHRLADVTVHVWGADPQGLPRALADSGFRVRPVDDRAAFADLDPQRCVVAVVADQDAPLRRLRAANEACLASGLTWLPVGAYDGATLHVGPLIVPRQSACLACRQRRLAANVAFADVFAEVAEAPCAPTPPALRGWAESLATLVLLHWIANRDPRLPGRLFTLAPEELTVRQSLVLPVPRCPVCAAPDFVPAAAPWGATRDH